MVIHKKNLFFVVSYKECGFLDNWLKIYTIIRKKIFFRIKNCSFSEVNPGVTNWERGRKIRNFIENTNASVYLQDANVLQ